MLCRDYSFRVDVFLAEYVPVADRDVFQEYMVSTVIIPGAGSAVGTDRQPMKIAQSAGTLRHT